MAVYFPLRRNTKDRNVHFVYEGIPKLSCLEVYFLYLEMLHTSSHILLTHDVTCCILPHGSCTSVMSDVKVREERVNATLGVNPQFLPHEQVCT